MLQMLLLLSAFDLPNVSVRRGTSPGTQFSARSKAKNAQNPTSDRDVTLVCHVRSRFRYLS